MVNVFCLPFAGANKYSYKGFIEKAPEQLRIIPVELPGRGVRHSENLLYSIDSMVLDILKQFESQFHQPYAIYGHSMGGIIGLELVRKIIAENLPRPCHLFFSGCSSPSFHRQLPKQSQLDREAFFQVLDSYGGCPEELLSNDELMRYFEPILRADFQALESYIYKKSDTFDIPMDIYFGTEENINMEKALIWQEETKNPISIEEFPGKHFFIFKHEAEIVGKIAKKTMKYV